MEPASRPLSLGDRETLGRVENAARAGDLSRATQLALDALQGGLAHPLLLNLRAYWHEREGRDADALADLQWAHRLAPDDVAILNALGLIAGRHGRFPEAREAFARAVALQPEFAPAHFNRGWACESLGALDEAKASYERAVALHPGQAPAYTRLAGLAARRADWLETGRLAGQALAIDSDQWEAELALAQADLAQARTADCARRVAALLARATLTADDRSMVYGTLGDLRHGEGRYAEAFAAYAAGNDEARRAHAPRFADGPGPGLVRWMHTWFETAPAWPRKEPPPDVVPAGHVFLVGFPRSGTTLLEQVLAEHPDAVSLEEKEAFADSAKVFLAGPEGLARLRTLSSDDRRRYRALYWDRVREYGVAPQGRIFIDKLPFNTLKLPLAAALFPEAKVLFALRDPRDVVLSCFRRRFRTNPLTFELLRLDTGARFYSDYMALAECMRSRLPLPFLLHRHEDLVETFDGEMMRICAFLGMDWTDRMRGFAQRAGKRTIATPSATQVMQGLNRDGVGVWRRYAGPLAPVLPILQPWVERFGYPAG